MPISKSSGSFRRNNKGFTLIEIVVVMGVIAILSSMMLGYGQRNNKQVLLVTSQAKIASIFARAKFLSIQSFFNLASEEEYVCAYGILITYPKTISIFKNISEDADERCPGPLSLSDLDYVNQYEYSKESVVGGMKSVLLSGELNQIQLSDRSGLELCKDGGCEGSDYFIFIPPEPIAKIVKFGDDADSLTVSVKLENEEEREFTLGVTVTKDGQIQVD